MKKDSLFYFLLGCMFNTICAILIISANPTPEAQWCDEIEHICGKCGAKDWHFVEAHFREEDMQ